MAIDECNQHFSGKFRRKFIPNSRIDKKYFAFFPEFIPSAKPGELRILVFNNNASNVEEDVEGYSAVQELVLPFDPELCFLREAGAPFGPAEPIWSYTKPGSFFSSFISSAQRLPNGNTLICSGAPGRVFEVTPAGEKVWEYLNPHEGNVDRPQGGGGPAKALFRATRIAHDHPGLAGRQL